MAILFELSESIIKRAALIASKEADRSLLSVIEECFEYGAKSLYSDAPKPIPSQRVIKPIEELYPDSPTKAEMNNIYSTVNNVTQQAQEDIESLEDSDNWESSYKSYSEPIIGEDGSFEL